MNQINSGMGHLVADMYQNTWRHVTKGSNHNTVARTLYQDELNLADLRTHNNTFIF
jgi:hypothetical protein